MIPSKLDNCCWISHHLIESLLLGFRQSYLPPKEKEPRATTWLIVFANDYVECSINCKNIV